MKCPKELRQCPHNWTDCNLCANLKACEDGTYVPETELEESELTVDLSMPIVTEPPVQDVLLRQNVRGTWAEQYDNMTEAERWVDYYKYHPPNLLIKEPITCLSGPTEPGGGNKNKSKKSKTGNKVYTDVWEGV